MRGNSDQPSVDAVKTIHHLHSASIRNKQTILSSVNAGCFHCVSIFPATTVRAWTEEYSPEGQTAMCPNCGIDSVIGDVTVPDLSMELLRQMKRFWF